MSSTARLTSDIDIIPYKPVPFQWLRRYQALLYVRDKRGLSDLMKLHHYGWWPSYVGKLAKWAYWEPSMEYMTDQAHLEWKIARLAKEAHASRLITAESELRVVGDTGLKPVTLSV